MYWLIVAGILVIIATGIAIHIYKIDIAFAPMHEIIIDAILWGIVIVIILCTVCVPIGFGVFERQATKERFGKWDFTPMRVLDMKPIGIR